MTADRCLLRKETLLRREEKLFGARHSDPEKGRERGTEGERESADDLARPAAAISPLEISWNFSLFFSFWQNGGSSSRGG